LLDFTSKSIMKSHQNIGRFLATGAVAFILSFTFAAHSQTWLIDFGRTGDWHSTSTANPDSNGHYWSSVGGFYMPGMLDMSGNVTPAAFGPDGIGGMDSYNGPAGVTFDPNQAVFNAVALGNLGINTAVYDYWVNSRFQIQGMDPTRTYRLTFFGSHAWQADTTRYSLYTDGSYSTALQYVDLNVHNPAQPWLHNQDTGAIMDVTGQGTFYIGFAGVGGDGAGFLNDMQIQVIPEPSTLALVGIGLAGLIARFRRRG
jgi:hypothetical protein